MSDLLLGLFINGAMTAVIVVYAVVLGKREDREAAANGAAEEELRRAS